MASIAEILLAQGQNKANSIRERAGAWQPLIGQLANLPAQMQADKRAEQQRVQAEADAAQARTLRGQQIDANSRQLTAEQAAAAEQKAIGDVFRTPGVFNPETGDYNVQRAHQAAMDAGVDWRKVQAVITDEAEKHAKLLKAQKDARPDAPKPPEPFTLGPGQSRFNPDGTPLANVPEAAPKLTFGAVSPVMVNGRRTLARAGSDGKLYDLKGAVLDNAAPDVPPSSGGGNEPLIPIIGPDGQPVLVPRSQAINKRPASTREQGRPVTSGDAGRIADFDTSLSDLAVLKTTLTATKDATGTGAAIGAATPAWVTDLTGWGTDAKKRQGVIDRVKQVIGKTLEGGVLRKEDEIKYEKILPTIRDTAEVAASKLAGLETAIKQRRSTFIDALGDAGYETGRFNQRSGGAQTADPLGIR